MHHFPEIDNLSELKFLNDIFRALFSLSSNLGLSEEYFAIRNILSRVRKRKEFENAQLLSEFTKLMNDLNILCICLSCSFRKETKFLKIKFYLIFNSYEKQTKKSQIINNSMYVLNNGIVFDKDLLKLHIFWKKGPYIFIKVIFDGKYLHKFNKPCILNFWY